MVLPFLDSRGAKAAPSCALQTDASANSACGRGLSARRDWCAHQRRCGSARGSARPRTGTGPLSADKHHGTGGWHEVRLIDAVTLFFFHNHRLDIGDEILIRRAFPEQRAQIVVVFAEEASTQLAFGGQPDARTLAPERLRDRSNQADLAGRVVDKAILARGFAALVRDLLERPARVNAAGNFGGRNPPVALLVAGGLEPPEFY